MHRDDKQLSAAAVIGAPVSQLRHPGAAGAEINEINSQVESDA